MVEPLAALRSQFHLPVFLNTLGLQAVVIGGGPVGQRKARMLLATGVAVRIVALEAPPDDLRHEHLEWLAEPYRPDHLIGAKLVFTAAPREICEQVHDDARSHGILVCRTDDAALGDFITPITISAGELRIAISTGGASPILARRIRDRLAEMFDETFGKWVELLDEWRHQAGLGSWDRAEGRHEFLERISDWAWLDRYRSEGPSAVKSAYAAIATELGLRGPVV